MKDATHDGEERQDGDENRTCDYGTDEDCSDDAIAIYEGIDPPAGTIRYAACNDHAPDDLPPIRWIGDRLATDGGTARSGDETPQAESVARDAIAVIEGAADDVRTGDDRGEIVDWLERQADDLITRLEDDDGN